MIPKVRDSMNQIIGLDEMIAYCVKEIGEIHLKVLEVGCYLGESTERFLMRPEIGELHCVDIWDKDYYKTMYGYQEVELGEIEKIFDDRVRVFSERIKKYKGTSEDAATALSGFDIIYLDADHSEESIKRDIELWLPHVKLGGFLCGHDYIGYRGVYDTVNRAFGCPDRVFFDSSWIKRIK